MLVTFIGSKKVTVLLLLLFLILAVWEGVTRQVPAAVLLIFAILLAANLICCFSLNAKRLKNRSVKQSGFLIFHAGLLLIILGGMVSYYTYSIGYVELAEGNSFTDERSSYNGWKQRFGIRKGTGVTIGLKKIHLSFWGNGQIREYTNRISIIDNGREEEAILGVNGSLRHGGLLINLARYFGLAPHFVLQTPHGRNEGYVYISDTRKTNTFSIPALGYKATVVYGKISDRSLVISVDRDGKGTITRSIVPGDIIDLGDGQLKLTGIPLWNGITVVSDSGKGITFAGFAMFITGLLMYYMRFFREVSINGRD